MGLIKSSVERKEELLARFATPNVRTLANMVRRNNTKAAISIVLIISVTAVTKPSLACDERSVTPATGMGPHYVENVSSETDLWKPGEEGEPIFLRSRVVDTCGNAIDNARVQLWHANHEGVHAENRWRSDFLTDEAGTFAVTTVMPGYAGGLARHIHFIVTHPDHEDLVTRVFFKNDPYIENQGVDDLALRLEEITRDGKRGWVTGYEFVLEKK